MAVSRIQDEILQCTICYETFDRPKILPCLHTFCEHCLTDFIKNASGVTANMGFSCPVCRDFVKAPDPTQPSSTWAAMFKTNFHMNKLKKALEEEPTREVPEGYLMCPDHRQQEIDLYCVACSRPICHLCAGISHRGCDLVVTLAEVSEDRRAQLQMMSRQMNTTLTKSREKVAEAKKCLENLNSLKDECRNEVETFTQSMIDILRQRKKQLLEEIDEKHERIRDRVNLKIDTFREQQKTYHQTHVQMTELTSRALPLDILRYHDTFRKSPSLDFSSISNLTEQLKRVDFKFISGEYVGKLSEMLQQIGRVVLDEVKPEVAQSNPNHPPDEPLKQVRHLKHVTSTHPQISDVEQVVENIRRKRVNSLPIPRKRPENPTITRLKTVSGKHKDDNYQPKLIDVIVMSQGEELNDILIVTDWNNQCLKTFHSSRDRDSRLHLGGKPWCLAALTKTTVAVSLPLSRQICVLKIRGSSIMLLSSVLAEKKYSGLAALDKHTMVASDASSRPSVDIINVSGEVLRSFSHDSSNSPLFSYPAYVCTTPTGHILVSDRDAGTLTCLTRDGTVQWCFHPRGARELVDTAGVVCDSRGHVLLVESRGVLGLTADGHYIGVVLRGKDGVDAPRGVFVGKSGFIYLTNKDEEVTVFKLKHGI